MILKCTCFHEYQDRIHGAGKRVHNPTVGSGGQTMWRCTVCKSERSEGSGANSAKSK